MIAQKIEIPSPALVQFKHGISTSRKTPGQHYVSLFIDQKRVSKVESLSKESLKARALRDWMLVQFGLELSQLKDRAGVVIPAFAGLSQWRYDQGDLKALIRVEPSTFDIDSSAPFEDVAALLGEFGHRLTFSKSAAKERIDYYLLTRKDQHSD